MVVISPLCINLWQALRENLVWKQAVEDIFSYLPKWVTENNDPMT